KMIVFDTLSLESIESEGSREQRLEDDRIRHAFSRILESDDSREQRLEDDRIRHAFSRILESEGLKQRLKMIVFDTLSREAKNQTILESADWKVIVIITKNNVNLKLKNNMTSVLQNNVIDIMSHKDKESSA
ncbi:hypothetical protein TNCT_256971, partial [Trichonephila clavata]